MLTDEQIQRLRRQRVKTRNRLSVAMEMHDAVTQQALAEAIGVTQVYISTLVRGDYKDVPLETTRNLANYFGCAIEDLFPRVPEMAAKS